MTSRETQLIWKSLGWRLTKHARETALRRDVEIHDVLLTAVDPEVTYTSGPAYGVDREVRQRGLLAVVVNPDTQVVITVLLRQTAQWTDEDARTR